MKNTQLKKIVELDISYLVEDKKFIKQKQPNPIKFDVNRMIGITK